MGPILLPSHAPPLRTACSHRPNVTLQHHSRLQISFQTDRSLRGRSGQLRCLLIVTRSLYDIFLTGKPMTFFSHSIHSHSNQQIYKHCRVWMWAPTCVPSDLIWTYLLEYKRKGNYLHDHTVIVLHPATEKFNYPMVDSSQGKSSDSGPSYLAVVHRVFQDTVSCIFEACVAVPHGKFNLGTLFGVSYVNNFYWFIF